MSQVPKKNFPKGCSCVYMLKNSLGAFNLLEGAFNGLECPQRCCNSIDFRVRQGPQTQRMNKIWNAPTLTTHNSRCHFHTFFDTF
uniref:Uncharacterized protein n=1 Tax=Anguilla anguilla TaxID=7936 RepID=A0A0E9PTT7_ANGAN